MQPDSATTVSVREATLPQSHGWALQAVRGWVALLLCLGLYFAQTLPFLSYRWVTDESWYAAPAYSLSQGHGLRDPAIGLNDIENHLDARPPGTAMVIAGFFRLFGVGQITARLGSILAGATLVILVYVLARDFFGSLAALVATLLLASDNLVFLTARTARPEALTVCMVFVSLLFIVHYQRRNSLIWPALSGMSLAAGAMFHITLLGYIASALFLVLVIDIERKTSWWRGVSACISAFLLGIGPYAIWIVSAPLGRVGFRTEFLARASTGSLLLRLVQEKRRYSDLLGLHMLHGHGLDGIPIRLPIPLFFLFCSYMLWKRSRRWFYVEMVLLAPTVLWLTYTVNKSSRYLLLLSPLFALTVGSAIYVLRENSTLQKAVVCSALFAVIAQTGANFFLMRASTKANYNEVARQLRSAIPRTETTYGTITFWMALHDRNYVSYERTTPNMAADEFGAAYFIVGDRMMIDPNIFGEKDFYSDLSREVLDLQRRSDLITQIHDPYYGDLSVYRLRRN